jgi:tetratricopeptide (TPR) repeat protein
LVIAVVPYYGPDEDSAKEGRVFATLVERNLRTQFHNQAGRILGIEETKVPVRSHDAARELARRLGATVVLWGHVLTLRGETEIEPSLTLLPPKDGAKPSGRDYSPFRLVRGSDPLASFVQRDEATLALPATTRSQIELRKTTAAGIGELVRTVAATHALYVERRPEKALALVSGLPEQSDTLRLKAEALVRLNRPAEALVALERVVTLDPEDAQALGLMGDLHLRSSRLDQAMAAYRAAAATANDFSTVEGLSFEGQILRREVVGRVSWSEEGEVVDSGETITSFLLMLDPETGRVSNRYLVPGPVMALNTEGGSPRITVEHRRSGRTSVLSLQEIASRPEVFLNLPRRVQLRTGGTALAENFLGELADPEAVGPARLSPRKGQLASDRPRTLAELDVSLRRASEEDPTQPLHLFFLGEVLWFQGRKEEAEHTWLRLAQGSYIAWPFSIYTYIADLFESFDQPEWADRFWAIAEEKARMRTIQPPFSSLIDRLIDVPTKGLYRSNRGRGDALRRFHRFQRAVEMTGPCMDGDELVATVWARFLTRSGERKAATEAKAIAERAASSRFNIPRHATATEYFAYLATGATTGLLFLLAVVAWRVARDLSPRPFRSLWRQIKDLAQEPTSPHDRLNRAALLVGGTSLVLLMLVNSLDLVVGGSLPTTPRIVLYDLMLLALILRLFTTQNNPIKALAAWAWRLRVSLCVGVLACAVSLGGFWSQARRLYMDLIIPVGLPEALGSFETLEALDLRPSDEQSAALQFVRAVAYHLAREETRAGRLYRSLAGREPRAKANLEALERGGPPVQLPTEKDYSRAFSRSSWEVARWGFFQLWDELQAGGLLELWIAGRAAPGAVGVGLILLLLGALGGRQVGGLRQRPELSGGVRRRLEVVLIPGVAWLGRGKPVLAWATVTLWSFVLVSCWFGISYGARTGFPGPLADALPLRAGSFARGFPWPYAWEAGQSPDELYRSAVFWSLPYAHRFWVIVALSGLTFLALHLLSLQAPLSRLWSPSGARTSA